MSTRSAPQPTVSVVLPCLDEAASLPLVLARIPQGWQAVVVDNGSTDSSPEIAARHGATVVHASPRGYGAAVHAGVESAAAPIVAVIDCDGTIDPQALVELVGDVENGQIDLVCGRRRPTGPGVWSWHARVGNAVLSAVIRYRTGLPLHDIAPVRVARRDRLLALGVHDRRFGYPLELLIAAARAGWTVREYDVAYGPRTQGSRSKVSGSLRGTARVLVDFSRVLSRMRVEGAR